MKHAHKYDAWYDGNKKWEKERVRNGNSKKVAHNRKMKKKKQKNRKRDESGWRERHNETDVMNWKIWIYNPCWLNFALHWTNNDKLHLMDVRCVFDECAISTCNIPFKICSRSIIHQLFSFSCSLSSSYACVDSKCFFRVYALSIFAAWHLWVVNCEWEYTFRNMKH